MRQNCRSYLARSHLADLNVLIGCRSEEGAGSEIEAIGSYDFFPITYILPGEYAIFVEVRRGCARRSTVHLN